MMAAPTTHRISLPVEYLKRGFWLYVWKVLCPKGSELLYVGRTGDSSSPRAVPPYQRMGQHLGHQKTQNALRKHLEKRGISPESCRTFEMFAHGPLYPEAADMVAHKKPRDIVAAIEKSLSDSLRAAGDDVLNRVHCRMTLDEVLHVKVIEAFAEHFPALLSNAR